MNEFEDNYTDEQIANIFGYALHLYSHDGKSVDDIFDELLAKYADNVEQFYEDTKDIKFAFGNGVLVEE